MHDLDSLDRRPARRRKETAEIEEMAAPAEFGGGRSGSKRLRGCGGSPVTGRRAANVARQGKAQGGVGSLRGRS
jgi:hypothetical protein